MPLPLPVLVNHWPSFSPFIPFSSVTCLPVFSSLQLSQMLVLLRCWTSAPETTARGDISGFFLHSKSPRLFVSSFLVRVSEGFCSLLHLLLFIRLFIVL